ncbi:MAG: AMP-binding protein [Oscillospiraceae bacterium]|jgi:acetyl-CoA synthetase|nr:AMP-binding protein [Oscillospiraceae bacterium]
MALAGQYLQADGFKNYEDFCHGLRLNAPPDFNFAFDVADRLAAETPHATALLWADARGGTGRCTFADIKAQSDALAGALSALGLGKGSVALLLLGTHHEYWPLLLALHKLGAVAVPCVSQLTAQDIAYRLQASEANAVFSTAEDGLPQRVEEAQGSAALLKVLVRGDRPGWRSHGALLSQAPAFARPAEHAAPRATDPLLLYFTSGTMGLPKRVVHDGRMPLACLAAARYWQGATPGGLHLMLSDTGWCKAAWGQVYGPWLAGCATFLWEGDGQRDAAALLAALTGHRVTSLCAPLGIYRALLAQDIEAHDLSALTRCALIAEPLHPDVYREFWERTGLEIREAYGLTETGVLVAHFDGVPTQPGSMGKPSPLYDVDILDEEGKPCPPGVSGEIAVRIGEQPLPGMFGGYEGETGSPCGVYRTGDIAWRDEWGYYWYVGRADDVILSSGYRIGPFEVETALASHPAVLEAAVTGAPDPLRHQVVKATVVLRPGYAPDDALARALQDHVKSQTAPYKCPRIVAFAPGLPKTASGKVIRGLLR